LHIIAVLCLGNIVYVGWVAIRQRDLNMLIGNSSVAHMGFCFLGIANLSLIGITGTIVVMVAHGFLAALSFALSGYIREQTNTLDMNKMSGLLRPMPFVGATLVIAVPFRNSEFGATGNRDFSIVRAENVFLRFYHWLPRPAVAA
jgi:NADH-quinone oxidoreductase subunit M